jgi:hypothetical protein
MAIKEWLGVRMMKVLVWSRRHGEGFKERMEATDLEILVVGYGPRMNEGVAHAHADVCAKHSAASTVLALVSDGP